MVKWLICLVCCLILLISTPQPGFGKNLHLIDELPNGFRIYRSGTPSETDLIEFNNLGISEIAVLSGDAERYELRYRHLVPDLIIAYNQKQDSHRVLSASFLQWFDTWVEEARIQGKIIAFRCACGCHRTGRLAAYYQMKYQGHTYEQVMNELNEHASWMFLHRDLEYQVKALEDYIHGIPCSQKPKYCVKQDIETKNTLPKIGSREELLKATRQKKIETPDRPRDIKVENYLNYAEDTKMLERMRLGFYGFTPVFGGMSTGSGFALGVQYRAKTFKEHLGLTGSARWSFKGYQHYEMLFRTEWDKPFPIHFGVGTRYRDYPEEDFYGLGIESRRENESNYQLKDFTIRSELLFPVRRYLNIGFDTGYLDTRSTSGKSPDAPSVEHIFPVTELPGFEESIKYFILAYRIMLDFRDSPGYPRSGGLLFFRQAFFDDYDHNAYSFTRTTGVIQGFLPFYHKHRVLVARLMYDEMNPEKGNVVPFHLLPTLGGGDTLRGYHEFRFRDNVMALVNVEYRFETFIGLDMALFADFGQVTENRNDLDLSEFKSSYGLGFRVNTNQGVFMRLDIGYGDEGTQVFFKFSGILIKFNRAW